MEIKEWSEYERVKKRYENVVEAVIFGGGTFMCGLAVIGLLFALAYWPMFGLVVSVVAVGILLFWGIAWLVTARKALDDFLMRDR